jgi:C4-dicarboxylate-specific signal transduction histidine kinase
MTSDSNTLFDDQRRFGGAVGASLSHEINNVLAIVSELNGILEDLHTFRKQDEPINPEKLENITGRIAAELSRGQDFVKRLNRFAHSVDHPISQMDLSDVILQVAGLIARSARLRTVTVETGPLAEHAVVTANRFDILHLLYRVLEAVVGASVKDSRITISLQREEDCYRVVIGGNGTGEITEQTRRALALAQVTAERLGGRIDSGIDTGTPPSLVLVLKRDLPCVI